MDEEWADITGGRTDFVDSARYSRIYGILLVMYAHSLRAVWYVLIFSMLSRFPSTNWLASSLSSIRVSFMALIRFVRICFAKLLLLSRHSRFYLSCQTREITLVDALDGLSHPPLRVGHHVWIIHPNWPRNALPNKLQTASKHH